nr:[citrate (pro-3S)-lyase] ligase [Streptococcus troglodytae]
MHVSLSSYFKNLFSDKKSLQKVDILLEQEGIRRDTNSDYICAMFDEDLNIIATGSCFGNTLRCLSVDHHYQGDGLLNEIVTHLIHIQFERGNTHLFLYTKPDTAKFFKDLGFYEIVRADQQIVFMENKKDGFSNYLKNLKKSDSKPQTTAALVINANPFTLGHQYLIEKASVENDLLHLFIVSEDSSLIPFSVRKQLVLEGTAHLSNVCYHETGPYIISKSTFPSYFQKDQDSIIESQARIDLAIFTQIAKYLGINKRYVGEEPTSLVTSIYNQIMLQELPKQAIDCIVIPRKTYKNGPISASTVRKALKEGNNQILKDLLPLTSLTYFLSPEAQPLIKKIRKTDNVSHY